MEWTIEKFRKVLKSRFPEADAWRTNGKTAVAFKPNGRVYEYSGTYYQVVSKIFEHDGVSVITRDGLRETEEILEKYRSEHGTVSKYSLFGNGPRDFSKQIAYYESKLEDMRKNSIIVDDILDN